MACVEQRLPFSPARPPPGSFWEVIEADPGQLNTLQVDDTVPQSRCNATDLPVSPLLQLNAQQLRCFVRSSSSTRRVW